VKNSLAAQQDRRFSRSCARRRSPTTSSTAGRSRRSSTSTEHDLLRQRRLGVESAVRTYFGGRGRKYRQSERLAGNVTPAEAALIAGMIASPSAYDPVQNPIQARRAARPRAAQHAQQRMLTQSEYTQAIEQAIPTRDQIAPPQSDSSQPYFTSWVTQQLVDRYGSGEVFGGGLKITSSIDPDMQSAAVQAIYGRLAGVGPSASLVAIDNKTGEVKAMVGGGDFTKPSVQSATNGHRQPGSADQAVHPRGCARARNRAGIGVGRRRRRSSACLARGTSGFVVHNFQNAYSGSTTPCRTHSTIPTTRCSRRWDCGSARARSRDWRTRWASGRPSRRTRPWCSGSEGGTHAARDGLCVRDDREPRQARIRQLRCLEARPVAYTKVVNGDHTDNQPAQDEARAAGRGRLRASGR